MSPAVKGSFIRVTTGTPGCKRFRLSAPASYHSHFATPRPDQEGHRRWRSTAVYGHRGSPDPAAGHRRKHPGLLHPGPPIWGPTASSSTCAETSDGALAVHHDPAVPGVGPLAELAAADLPPSVPLLGAALDACAGMVVNIEIKNLPGEPGFDPEDRHRR